MTRCLHKLWKLPPQVLVYNAVLSLLHSSRSILVLPILPTHIPLQIICDLDSLKCSNSAKWLINWLSLIIRQIFNVPGHALALQLSTPVDKPIHSWQPNFASVFMSLIFVRSPPPHVFEHSPCSHSAHSQSTSKWKIKEWVISLTFHYLIYQH